MTVCLVTAAAQKSFVSTFSSRCGDKKMGRELARGRWTQYSGGGNDGEGRRDEVKRAIDKGGEVFCGVIGLEILSDRYFH